MGKIIELIIRAVPYPHLIRDIEVATKHVEFTWRGVRYRVTETFGVDEVGDGVLMGTDRAILMRSCIDFARSADATTVSERQS